MRRGFRTSRLVRSALPWGFVAPRSCTLRPVIGTFRVVPRPAGITDLPCPIRAFPVAVPGHCRDRFVLPRALSVPFEAHALHRPPAVPSASWILRSACIRRERLPWGLAVPSSRLQPATSTFDEGSQPSPDVPPSAFRAPSAACSVTGLAGLFRPAATSRVHPSGVSPSRWIRTGFRRPRPSFRSSASDCGCPRRRKSSRIQGFHPQLECGVDEHR